MPASNTFDRTNPGSAVSIRENLLDGFYMVAPEDTPLQSALPKKGLDNTHVSWTVDDYGSIDNDPIPEGQDATEFKNQAENRARVQNFQTIREETGKVTDVMERADNAATPNERAFTIVRAIMKLNLKVEKTAYGTQAAVNSTKPEASGFSEMLSGSSVVFSGGASAYQTPADQVKTAVAPTEKNVDDVLRSMHINGANTSNITVFADANWMQAFTDDTLRILEEGVNDKMRVNLSSSDQTIEKKVTVYRGPFGRVTFVDTNPRVAGDIRSQLDRALFMDMSMATLFENKPKNVEPDDAGGGPRNVFKRYFTFKYGNPKAGALWNSIA